MKYGVIVQNYGKYALNMDKMNAGDPFQAFVLQYIYEKMGIAEKDIVKIPVYDLKTYSGEYAVTPIYGGLGFSTTFASLPFSPKIIPVFISVYSATTYLKPEWVDCLRAYAPVGCRDEMTLSTMRKYNIPAYLSGCFTVVYPRREAAPKDGEIFMVDTPDSLEPFLPESIRQNAKRISQMIPMPEGEMTDEIADEMLGKCSEKLEHFKNSASLVISGKQHTAALCMAMGIPVITAFENISYRFAWLDKYLKLYSTHNFSEIDWDPKPVDYEKEKEWLLNFFSGQIRAAYEKFAPCYNVSEYYENRIRSNYGNYYSERIKAMHGYMPENFSYIIWGCGQTGSIVYEIMQREFPEAKLAAAADSYIEGEWQNVPIIKPNEIEKYEGAFVVLANYTGRIEGFELMSRLGRVENKDFVYVGTHNG